MVDGESAGPDTAAASSCRPSYRRQGLSTMSLVEMMAVVSLQDDMSRFDIGVHFGQLQIAFCLSCDNLPVRLVSTVPHLHANDIRIDGLCGSTI